MHRRLVPTVPLSRRARFAGVAVAVAALAAGALPATAAPPPEELSLSAGPLQVRLSRAFPQVLGWSRAGDALGGNPAPLDSMLINGERQPVRVTSATVDGSVARYRLTLDRLSGATIDVEITLAEAGLDFRVTRIAEPTGVTIDSLEIPGHDIVSISSSDPDGVVAASRTSVDRATSGDVITEVDPDTAPIAPAGSAYVLASTGEVAAAFESNSLYDSADARAAMDDNRFVRHTVSDADGVRVGISSGQWLRRAEGSTQTEELPWFRVALTGDANADGTVDWQDAAIAMRSIAVMPQGGEKVADAVVQRIPMNFASQATHPFLRTLDDTKRIALATDGLGQHAVLKGFGNEGHDSANTDFADNYNTRAGGLRDLNALLTESRRWNTSYGIHINQTEAYPESLFFDEDIIDPQAPGWNWLDQSYYLDQRKDVLSGRLAQRIAKFRRQTDTNLDMVYVDVYYQHGWLADRLQRELTGNGFRVGSEWSDKLPRNNTWAHWAVDENYGGASNKGINSQIQRFIFNDVRDTWNPHPLLGNARSVEFEGWTGQNDYPGFLDNVWQQNLPTKFLQQHRITRWDEERIDFTDGVSATGTSADDRVITIDGTPVARGGTYLLPWDDGLPATRHAAKAYHLNPAGGTSSWRVTGALASARTLTLHRLTDDGRGPGVRVPVVDGRVTLTAEAGKPYVLVADTRTPQVVPAYGSGTPVADPGFNNRSVDDDWDTTGAVGTAVLPLGHRVAELGAGPAAISQRLRPLGVGTWSVSAWIEVEPGAQRPTTLTVGDGGVATASRTITRSTAENLIAADEKHDTHFQRVRVLVDVATAGARPTLTISAADGTAAVRVDDVRVVPTERVASDGMVAEDFEHVDQGWGPFVKGTAGGVTDPRTHLSQRHEPYTQAGWNTNVIDDVLGGTWSLKSNGENSAPGGGPSLVYRTSEETVAFAPGHRYRVAFDHQSAQSGQYAWVDGYDTAAGPVVAGRVDVGQVRTTQRLSHEFTAGRCGAWFTGLQRTGSSSAGLFVLDDLEITDLGPADDQPACGSLALETGGQSLKPGQVNELTTRFTSNEPTAVSAVAVELDVPDGWTVAAATPASAGTLAPGGTLTTTWRITPPTDATGRVSLGARVGYTADGEPRTTTTRTPVDLLTAFPSGATQVGDHPWVSAVGGWGPVERNLSNGGQDAGDGPPLRIGGVAFAKGIGTHAPSTVRYWTGGRCSSFTAAVGVDDVQTGRGSVRFTVLADGRQVTRTGVLRHTDPVERIEADITGAEYVDLVVDDGGDDNGNDHADWADAVFTCA